MNVHRKFKNGGLNMARNEDRRIALTKRLLKEALTALLKTKDLYHVTIRELCQRADVNRSTFYRYYGSQFDLLSDMENDLLSFVSKTVAEHESEPKKILVSVCRYLEQNLEFARLIVNHNVDPTFPHRLFSLDGVKKSVLEKCAEPESDAEADYLFNFTVYGAYRIICLWLNRERREPPERIAALIDRLTTVA